MIRELKTLVAIARHGTFAAAAERQHVTQAAVSAQMKRLEAELGFAIFDRAGRATVFNARGRQLVLQASDILALYDQLGESRPSQTCRTLVIGAIASIQRSLLPRAIAALHDAHPDGAYRIVPGLSIELLDQLDSGELDIGAMIQPPFALAPGLQWTTLAREPFVVVVHERRASEHWTDLLARHPFIRYDRSSFGGRQVDRFLQARQIAVDERFEIDELDAITELVALDLGVALVPETAMLGKRPENVRAIGLGKDTFYREIGCAFNPVAAEDDVLIRVRTLIDSLRRVVGSTARYDIDSSAPARRG